MTQGSLSPERALKRSRIEAQQDRRFFSADLGGGTGGFGAHGSGRIGKAVDQTA